MADNDQNKNFRNQEFYGAPDQNANNSARNSTFGQVRPGIPPYGEPRRYDNNSQQQYQTSQINPAYSKPQAPPQPNSAPYTSANNAQKPDPAAYPGYPGMNAAPQNNAPKPDAPLVNPFGGPVNKLYSSSSYDGDTVYEAYDSGKRSKRTIIIVSVILLLAAIGAGVFFLFFKNKSGSSSSDGNSSADAAVTEASSQDTSQHTTENSSETDQSSLGKLVETPDVEGMNMRIAKVKLEEMGFRVKFKEEYSDSVSADDVISQNIKAYEKVPLDTEITLTISKGREPVTKVEVPSVKDMNYSEASDRLKDLGFNVELEFLNSSSIQKDKIISQSISSGTQAEKGSKIILVVSKGPEASSTRTGIVNTKETALNIRKSPSTDAEIIGGADKGEKVTIIGEDGSWYIIRYKNVTGYVSKDYIELA